MRSLYSGKLVNIALRQMVRSLSGLSVPHDVWKAIIKSNATLISMIHSPSFLWQYNLLLLPYLCCATLLFGNEQSRSWSTAVYRPNCQVEHMNITFKCPHSSSKLNKWADWANMGFVSQGLFAWMVRNIWCPTPNFSRQTTTERRKKL